MEIDQKLKELDDCVDKLRKANEQLYEAGKHFDITFEEKESLNRFYYLRQIVQKQIEEVQKLAKELRLNVEN